MLKLYYNLSDIGFYPFMQIYQQSIEISGKERYKSLPPSRQRMEAEQDFYRYLQDFFLEESALYAIWSENGEAVAALRAERYLDGYLLEGLETAPEHRNKGYGKKLMQQFLTEFVSEKKLPVYSHIKKDNAGSLHLHISCGFTIISHQSALIDGTKTNDYYTLQWTCGA